MKLTDWHTDTIFDVQGCARVVADVSRVFCDVERLVPDDLEPMASLGMGFYYTHTDDGRLMRDERKWKDLILRDYYEPHHLRLKETVASILKDHGRCLIVDCHSFSDLPFARDVNQDRDRPDICIGTQGIHTPDWLCRLSEKFWRELGYSVRFDFPYSGSMVPLVYLDREPGVMSIMIELNRRLYLGFENRLIGSIGKLRKLVGEYIQRIVDVDLAAQFLSVIDICSKT